MGFMKGQGSTEYIVMLAVVMVIVLITAALLGFFPSFAGDAQATQSDSYWGSTRPIAITNSLQTTVINVTAENHGSKEITFNMSLTYTNGTILNNVSMITLSPGAKTYVAFYNTSNAFGNTCQNKGGSRAYLNVNITYNDPDLSGRVFVGQKPLGVLCS